jgi:hypothetical protein
MWPITGYNSSGSINTTSPLSPHYGGGDYTTSTECDSTCQEARQKAMAERSEDMITFLFWFFVFVVAFAISAVIASVNAEHARKVEEENRRQHEKKIRHVDNYNLKLELEKWKMRNHR